MDYGHHPTTELKGGASSFRIIRPDRLKRQAGCHFGRGKGYDENSIASFLVAVALKLIPGEKRKVKRKAVDVANPKHPCNPDYLDWLMLQRGVKG